MEEFKGEVPVLSNDMTDLDIMIYDAVSRFKSIRRAQRRGHVSKYGTIAPKRPFNNRANTSTRKDIHSRSTNEMKKYIYGRIKSE